MKPGGVDALFIGRLNKGRLHGLVVTPRNEPQLTQSAQRNTGPTSWLPFTTLPRTGWLQCPADCALGPCTPVRAGNRKPPSWRTQTDTLPLRAVSGGRSGRPGIKSRRSAHTAAVRSHAYGRLCVQGAEGDFLERIKGVREHPQPPGRQRGPGPCLTGSCTALLGPRVGPRDRRGSK